MYSKNGKTQQLRTSHSLEPRNKDESLETRGITNNGSGDTVPRVKKKSKWSDRRRSLENIFRRRKAQGILEDYKDSSSESSSPQLKRNPLNLARRKPRKRHSIASDCAISEKNVTRARSSSLERLQRDTSKKVANTATQKKNGSRLNRLGKQQRKKDSSSDEENVPCYHSDEALHKKGSGKGQELSRVRSSRIARLSLKKGAKSLQEKNETEKVKEQSVGRFIEKPPRAVSRIEQQCQQDEKRFTWHESTLYEKPRLSSSGKQSDSSLSSYYSANDSPVRESARQTTLDQAASSSNREKILVNDDQRPSRTIIDKKTAKVKSKSLPSKVALPNISVTNGKFGFSPQKNVSSDQLNLIQPRKEEPIKKSSVASHASTSQESLSRDSSGSQDKLPVPPIRTQSKFVLQEVKKRPIYLRSFSEKPQNRLSMPTLAYNQHIHCSDPEISSKPYHPIKNTPQNQSSSTTETSESHTGNVQSKNYNKNCKAVLNHCQARPNLVHQDILTKDLATQQSLPSSPQKPVVTETRRQSPNKVTSVKPPVEFQRPSELKLLKKISNASTISSPDSESQKKGPPPPPPIRRSRPLSNIILETAGQKLDQIVEEASRKCRSAHLEDALTELEQIYHSLQLDSEDLMDRAERRDAALALQNQLSMANLQKFETITSPPHSPSLEYTRRWLENNQTHHVDLRPVQLRLLERDLLDNSSYQGSSASELLEIQRQANQNLLHCRSNSPGNSGGSGQRILLSTRKSTVPDKVADDMAQRKMQKADGGSPAKLSTSPMSFLLCSPLTPVIPIEVDKDEDEPDVITDDVVYRQFQRSTGPGVNIPPKNTAPSSPRGYANAKMPVDIKHRKTRHPAATPDIIRDDLAFRNLRKDRKDKLRPWSVIIPQNFDFEEYQFWKDRPARDETEVIQRIKKKYAARSISANLSSIMRRYGSEDDLREWCLSLPDIADQSSKSIMKCGSSEDLISHDFLNDNNVRYRVPKMQTPRSIKQRHELRTKRKQVKSMIEFNDTNVMEDLDVKNHVSWNKDVPWNSSTETLTSFINPACRYWSHPNLTDIEKVSSAFVNSFKCKKDFFEKGSQSDDGRNSGVEEYDPVFSKVKYVTLVPKLTLNIKKHKPEIIPERQETSPQSPIKGELKSSPMDERDLEQLLQSLQESHPIKESLKLDLSSLETEVQQAAKHLQEELNNLDRQDPGRHRYLSRSVTPRSSLDYSSSFHSSSITTRPRFFSYSYLSDTSSSKRSRFLSSASYTSDDKYSGSRYSSINQDYGVNRITPTRLDLASMRSSSIPSSSAVDANTTSSRYAPRNLTSRFGTNYGITSSTPGSRLSKTSTVGSSEESPTRKSGRISSRTRRKSAALQDSSSDKSEPELHSQRKTESRTYLKYGQPQKQEHHSSSEDLSIETGVPLFLRRAHRMRKYGAESSHVDVKKGSSENLSSSSKDTLPNAEPKVDRTSENIHTHNVVQRHASDSSQFSDRANRFSRTNRSRGDTGTGLPQEDVPHKHRRSRYHTSDTPTDSDRKDPNSDYKVPRPKSGSRAVESTQVLSSSDLSSSSDTEIYPSKRGVFRRPEIPSVLKRSTPPERSQSFKDDRKPPVPENSIQKSASFRSTLKRPEGGTAFLLSRRQKSDDDSISATAVFKLPYNKTSKDEHFIEDDEGIDLSKSSSKLELSLDSTESLYTEESKEPELFLPEPSIATSFSAVPKTKLSAYREIPAVPIGIKHEPIVAVTKIAPGKVNVNPSEGIRKRSDSAVPINESFTVEPSRKQSDSIIRPTYQSESIQKSNLSIRPSSTIITETPAKPPHPTRVISPIHTAFVNENSPTTPLSGDQVKKQLNFPFERRISDDIGTKIQLSSSAKNDEDKRYDDIDINERQRKLSESNVVPAFLLKGRKLAESSEPSSTNFLYTLKKSIDKDGWGESSSSILPVSAKKVSDDDENRFNRAIVSSKLESPTSSKTFGGFVSSRKDIESPKSPEQSAVDKKISLTTFHDVKPEHREVRTIVPLKQVPITEVQLAKPKVATVSTVRKESSPVEVKVPASIPVQPLGYQDIVNKVAQSRQIASKTAPQSLSTQRLSREISPQEAPLSPSPIVTVQGSRETVNTTVTKAVEPRRLSREISPQKSPSSSSFVATAQRSRETTNTTITKTVEPARINREISPQKGPSTPSSVATVQRNRETANSSVTKTAESARTNREISPQKVPSTPSPTSTVQRNRETANNSVTKIAESARTNREISPQKVPSTPSPTATVQRSRNTGNTTVTKTAEPLILNKESSPQNAPLTSSPTATVQRSRDSANVTVTKTVEPPRLSREISPQKAPATPSPTAAVQLSRSTANATVNKSVEPPRLSREISPQKAPSSQSPTSTVQRSRDFAITAATKTVESPRLSREFSPQKASSSQSPVVIAQKTKEIPNTTLIKTAVAPIQVVASKSPITETVTVTIPKVKPVPKVEASKSPIIETVTITLPKVAEPVKSPATETIVEPPSGIRLRRRESDPRAIALVEPQKQNITNKRESFTEKDVSLKTEESKDKNENLVPTCKVTVVTSKKTDPSVLSTNELSPANIVKTDTESKKPTSPKLPRVPFISKRKASTDALPLETTVSPSSAQPSPVPKTEKEVILKSPSTEEKWTPGSRPPSILKRNSSEEREDLTPLSILKKKSLDEIDIEPHSIMKKKSLEELDDKQKELQGILKIKFAKEEIFNSEVSSILKSPRTPENSSDQNVFQLPSILKTQLDDSTIRPSSILKQRSFEIFGGESEQKHPSILRMKSLDSDNNQDSRTQNIETLSLQSILRKKKETSPFPIRDGPSPELALVLKSRREQEQDSEDSSEEKFVDALSFDISSEQIEGEKGGLSVAERIFEMENKIEEVKFCNTFRSLPATPFSNSGQVTPKGRLGSVTPPIKLLSRSGDDSTPYLEETLSKLLGTEPISDEQLLSRLTSVASDDRRRRLPRRDRAGDRYRTQPVTLDEIEETDGTEAVAAFRSLIVRKACFNVFEQREKESAALSKYGDRKTEYPHHIKKRKGKDRGRYKTLPVTVEERSEAEKLIETSKLGAKVEKCIDKKEEMKNEDKKKDTEKTDEESAEDELSKLSVSAKTSLFKQLEAQQKKASELAHQAIGAHRKINKRFQLRSQTQPVTEDEVKIAAKLAAEDTVVQTQESNVQTKVSFAQTKESVVILTKEFIPVPEVVNRSKEAEDQPTASDSDDDVSRLSLAEKMKIFAQQTESKPPPKSLPPVLKKRRGCSRFKTQPITLEEVEKAAKISPLAITLIKPPDPDVLSSMPLNAARDFIAKYAEETFRMSSSGSQSDSRRDSTSDSRKDSLSDESSPKMPDEKGMKAVFRINDAAEDKPTFVDNTHIKGILKPEKERALERPSRGALKKDSSFEKEPMEIKSILKMEKSAMELELENAIKALRGSESESEHDSITENKTSIKMESVTQQTWQKQGKEEATLNTYQATVRQLQQIQQQAQLQQQQLLIQQQVQQQHVQFHQQQVQIQQQFSEQLQQSEFMDSRFEDRRKSGNLAVQRRRNAALRRMEESDDDIVNRRSMHVESVTQMMPEKPPEVPTDKRKVKTFAHRSMTAPLTTEEVQEAEEVTEVHGASIAERLAALRRGGHEDWKKRLSRIKDPDEVVYTDRDAREGSPSKHRERTVSESAARSVIVEKLTLLEDAQDVWRSRIEEKDATQFTVAGKMNKKSPKAVPENSPLSGRKKKTPKPITFRSKTASFLEIPSPSSPTQTEVVISTAILPTPLTSTPIGRTGRPLLQKSLTLGFVGEGESQLRSEDSVAPARVEIHRADDDDFTSFFNQYSAEQLKSLKIDIDEAAFDKITQTSELLVHKRTVKTQRKHMASKNPLKTLAQRTDLQSNYVEVKSGIADIELRRIKKEQVAKDATFAQSALAGLASREDFSRISLRKTPINTNAPMLPYQDLMLLQVKGRRHVQTRLVEPCIKSLNSGDCFILVTPNEVFHWIGEFNNVIEKAKAAEVAGVIQAKKDLGCKMANDVITIEEEKVQPKAKKKLFSLLGAKEGESIREAGHPDEDELYEACIIETNMIYKVDKDQLVPYKEYWGNLPKLEMLESKQVLVFDFGTEMYVWLGKQAPFEIRRIGIQLAKELWDEGYDYAECDINPISPNIGDTSPSKVDSKRPSWALFGKQNEHMETVLFREKFLDWPDPDRIIKVKGPDSDIKADASLELSPYDARLMLIVNTDEPSLVLEGQNIGRGVEWVDEMERRQYDINTLKVTVWHILEYNHTKLHTESAGQFHSGDTYVVRWQYMITNVGARALSGAASRWSFVGRERCAYFFWQGKDSTINEKGASALMTVELDEERGPHVRVVHGKEPPCFLNLFDGGLVIHIGKREEEETNSPGPWKLYIARNELENEGCLVEVPCKIESLRSRSSFVCLNTKQKSILIWHGSKAHNSTRKVARRTADKIKEKQPSEIGFEEKDEISIFDIHEGCETEEFCQALGSHDCSLYTSLVNDSRLYNFTPRLFGMSSVSGQFEAQEILCPSRTNKVVCPFPFLQTDLYKNSQPALFLIDNHYEVFLWQGWWPEGEEEGENVVTGSAKVRWDIDRRCAMETAIQYCKEKDNKNSLMLYLVSAGLEPKSFTNLFPFWEHSQDIAELNMRDGRRAGEMPLVTEVLAKLSRKQYTLAELQEQPEGVDPSRLESYLSETEFYDVLRMSKEEFYALPAWKQNNLKKTGNLF